MVHKGAIEAKLAQAEVTGGLLRAKQMICRGSLSMCQLQFAKAVGPNGRGE